jgi:hypothetical protein
MFKRGIERGLAGSAAVLWTLARAGGAAPWWRWSARRAGPSHAPRQAELILIAALVRWLEPLERRLCLAGSIAGQAFQDNNGNGVLDAGEPGLSGVTLYLDLDASNSLTAGDAWTVSAAGGSYSFTGLADGDYSVGETTPAGNVRTGSAFQSATVAGGGAVTGKNLGNFPTVMTGTSSSDSFKFKIDSTNPSRVQISATLGAGGGTTQYFIAKSLLPSFTFNLTLGGDDQVTIDYTAGDPLPAGGLNIDGGGDTSGVGDQISVLGNGGADVISIASLTVSPGGAGVIGIKNVERVTVSSGAGDDALTLGPAFATGFATGLFFDGGSGTDSLTYTGTDSADTVTLNAGSIVSGALTHTYSQVESLAVNLRGGSDAVTVNHNAAAPPLALDVGDGDDAMTVNSATTTGLTLTGGDGNDTLVVGASVSAPLSFAGGNGSDRLTINGSGGNDVLHIGPAMFFREGNVYPISFVTAEELLVDAGAGNDAVDISGGTNLLPVTVSGNDGADTLYANGGGAVPPTTYNGGNGTDRLTFYGTAGADTIVVSPNLVSRQGNPNDVSFSQTEQLTVQCGDGNDLTVIAGASAATAVSVLGEGGNDSLLQDLAGTTAVTFDGGPGANDATFVGSIAADNITVAAALVSAPGKSLAFSNVQALVVDASAGGDTITLSATAGATAVTIRGGTGNDTLIVPAAPSSAVHFEGGLTPTDHDTFNLNAGAVLFDADSAATSANLILNVAAGATAYFSASQHLERLDVAGEAAFAPNGNQALVTTQFALSGTLDLADNDLVINYTGASPIGTWDGGAYTGVQGCVAAARSGGTWSGTGLTASGTRFQPPNRTGLGVSEASEALALSGSATAVWCGQTVDATTVLVKFTYVGDVDLNGRIDGDDYFVLDSKIAMSGVVFGYARGDLNFDGRIDGDDLFFMDLNQAADDVPL